MSFALAQRRFQGEKRLQTDAKWQLCQNSVCECGEELAMRGVNLQNKSVQQYHLFFLSCYSVKLYYFIVVLVVLG